MATSHVFVIGLVLGGLVGGLGVYGLTSSDADDNKMEQEIPPQYQVPLKRLVMSSYNFDLIVPENQFYILLEHPKYLRSVAAQIVPRDELMGFYNQASPLNDAQNVLLIEPKFTEAAYNEPGFYTFFRGECDENCLTVTLGDYPPHYTASKNGFKVLSLLGYESITDLELHQNPSILQNYDKIILLHNEYVTQEMFDAITSHPKVIYLYPNALYGKVVYNENNNSITLIRGHNYPETSILNGFDWEFENTHPYEYDTDCFDWEFMEIDNGYQLNCYPEFHVLKDQSLLKMIKDL